MRVTYAASVEATALTIRSTGPLAGGSPPTPTADVDKGRSRSPSRSHLWAGDRRKESLRPGAGFDLVLVEPAGVCSVDSPRDARSQQRVSLGWPTGFIGTAWCLLSCLPGWHRDPGQGSCLRPTGRATCWRGWLRRRWGRAGLRCRRVRGLRRHRAVVVA